MSRELFSQTAKSSRDKLAPTGVVQCRNAGDCRLHRPGRQAPHAGGSNRICRSELVSRAFQPNPKSSRASSLLQGLCSAEMRQIADFTVQAGRHPMQEAATAPVGASLLASFSTKPQRARETSSLLQVWRFSLYASCSSIRPRPGSGRRTGSVRQRWHPCPPDARPG